VKYESERFTVIECKTGRRANVAALAEFPDEHNQCANSILGRALHNLSSTNQQQTFFSCCASMQQSHHPKSNLKNTSELPLAVCMLLKAAWYVVVPKICRCERRDRPVRAKHLCYRYLSCGHATDCSEKTDSHVWRRWKALSCFNAFHTSVSSGTDARSDPQNGMFRYSNRMVQTVLNEINVRLNVVPAFPVIDTLIER